MLDDVRHDDSRRWQQRHSQIRELRRIARDRIEARLARAPRLIKLDGLRSLDMSCPPWFAKRRCRGLQRLREIKLDGFRLDYRGTERQNSSLTVSLLMSN